MGFDALEAMTLIAREKNIDMDLVIETVEAGLLAAARKKYGYIDNLSFKFDRGEGELTMISLRTVVEKVTDPIVEISLAEASELDPEAELDDQMEIFIDPVEEFGRSAIASAKQILIQRIREAERDRIYDEYISRVGQMISGAVQQIDKGNVIVNLGRAEAILPVREQISREKYRQGDRIRAIILDVQKSMKGPQIVLSRVSTDFIVSLFELEVPEIFEKIIEIRAIAREPGERTKLAVYSADERIDPVGACVGIKGVRVQSIVRELNNERIDIVAFTSSPEVFVTRALAPAKVVTIDVFNEERAMTVAVEDDKLSLAIGKSGQNARLASRLTGWKINIMSETDFNDMKREEAELMVPIGMLSGVGDVMEERLVEADITSVQDLSNSSVEELTELEGIGDKTAERLIERAVEYMSDLEEKRRLEKEAAEAEADEDSTDADEEESESDAEEESADEDEEEFEPEADADDIGKETPSKDDKE
ncbi:MAG: transcription termination/antitermination protein NusA [FCB group bacterium]|nr:transcription termination/antitermination protein NusA [FCB group bacterium]